MGSDDPSTWTQQDVTLEGLDGLLFPEDPEPEFVAINDNNICVVTLQENNAIVLVDLTTASVVASFTAGNVESLSDIDTVEEDIITSDSSLQNVPREPDGVIWISPELFATADEGDLDGGSRGWTIYNVDGEIVYTSGSFMELQTKTVGHYPEARSENKGNEPENIAYGTFDSTPYAFVVSERSSVIFVYDVTDPAAPVYTQVLPAGAAPEGMKNKTNKQTKLNISFFARLLSIVVVIEPKQQLTPSVLRYLTSLFYWIPQEQLPSLTAI